ncbi:hypothetical protein ACFLZX_02200 [Nanoarchaeota archaeon]
MNRRHLTYIIIAAAAALYLPKLLVPKPNLNHNVNPIFSSAPQRHTPAFEDTFSPFTSLDDYMEKSKSEYPIPFTFSYHIVDKGIEDFKEVSFERAGEIIQSYQERGSKWRPIPKERVQMYLKHNADKLYTQLIEKKDDQALQKILEYMSSRDPMFTNGFIASQVMRTLGDQRFLTDLFTSGNENEIEQYAARVESYSRLIRNPKGAVADEAMHEYKLAMCEALNNTRPELTDIVDNNFSVFDQRLGGMTCTALSQQYFPMKQEVLRQAN